jgi:aminoglycoside phosphotransferase (APT) family kinase protein
MPGGASRQTWLVVADVGGVNRRLVLRVDRGGGGLGLHTEAQLLRAAAAVGVPVPELVGVGDLAGEHSGSCLVTAWVPGESVPRRVLSAPELSAARARLAADCGRAVAAIQQIPPSAVPGLDGGDPLARLRWLADATGAAQPALELGLRWLAAHQPPARQPVVVHGDFRTGNLIVGPDGLRAVLDWELAHLGAPLEDLGWLCAEPWRFGSPLPVGGFGHLDDLVAAYTAESGQAVDGDELRWWRIYALVRWGLICRVQAERHRTGAVRSVDLAATGRRLCEVEWDLLEALELSRAPTQLDDPSAGAGGVSTSDPVGNGAAVPLETTGPHDPPTAVELLGSVEELLRGPALEATEGLLRYQLRVAANVVAMVAREVQLGPTQAADHRQRLERLGVADDRALAEGIRSGAFDERLADVAGAVRAAVAAKLAVANPSYWVRSRQEASG